MKNAQGYSPPFLVNAQGPHTHSCILLHGRGSDEERFGLEFLASRMSDGKILQECFPGTKFIFPTAKKRRSSILKRMRINHWFDNYSLEDPSQREHLQEEGLRETTAFIHGIIREEIAVVGARNILLGGLSQGCASSVYALLTFEDTLGGFIGMSGWMPLQHRVNEILNPVNSDESEDISFEFQSGDNGELQGVAENSDSIPTKVVNFLRESLSMDTFGADNLKCLRAPVFMGHGEADEKVSCALGESLKSTLCTLGMNVEWKTYPDFGHWYKVPEEIDVIRSFLENKLGR